MIRTKLSTIGIIGLGYVGLPLAINCAQKGFRVVGYDVDEGKVENLKKGEGKLSDVKDEELKAVVDEERLIVSDSVSVLRECEVFVICVPTPLTKQKAPDTSYIESAAEAVVPYLKKGSLVVLESSTYPGTTEEVLVPILEKSGMKAGTDFHVAYSPERVDPGNKNFQTHNIPKIVGGISVESTLVATEFYTSIIENVHPVSSASVAEMVKVFENSFRLINISFVNEMALLCDRMKIDIWEVIEAAKTKPFGFMPFYPGPGTGGHCIPVDPFYLSWKAKELNFFARFTSLAGEINELMPHFVVTKVMYALNKDKKALNGAKILMMGMAYKKDIGDWRESPALKIYAELTRKHAQVDYFDPHIPNVEIDQKQLSSIDYSQDSLKHYDLVLITTDHSEIDYDEIAQKASLVVDTRNAIKGRECANVHRI